MGRVWDFIELPKVMDRYAKSFPQAVQSVVQVMAEAGLVTLVQGTPADTGRAISNWKVTVGAPFGIYVPTRSPGMMQGVGAGFLSQTMIQEGVSTINHWTVNAGDLNIANNAPYIGMLNDGRSDKRPANFFAKAISNIKLRGKSLQVLKITKDVVYGKRPPKAGENIR